MYGAAPVSTLRLELSERGRIYLIKVPSFLRQGRNGCTPDRKNVRGSLIRQFNLCFGLITSMWFDLMKLLSIDGTISPVFGTYVFLEHGILNGSGFGQERLRFIILDSFDFVMVSPEGPPQVVIIMAKIVDECNQRRGNFSSHDFKVRS